nr:RNA-directed DNA polymerase, eukaryota [Tanacetum cinerariifolium]
DITVFFTKRGVTVSISDNFIALYGTWLPTNSKVLIVVIYAPQSAVLKRILWDYTLGLINRWKGETIVLGDFNVVRFEEERFGSFFNQSCARAFNQFISSSGLVEVKMEGYSFTWSHPSATKMNLKKTIRAWIKDTNKSYVGVKKSISDELVAIDKILDTGAVSDELLANRLDLSHKFHELNQLDLKEAAQKAKLAIRGVFHNGDWHTDPNLVKRTFLIILLLGFNNLISLVLNLVCRFRLSPDQMEELDKSINTDEIRVAVWDCGENNSPGPDGYTFEFFRRFWNLIGPDFCSAVLCFFDHGFFLRGCNSSFIALIPKVTDTKFVTDFWPVSLIGSVYKVVTKILANRLAMVISDLVSNTQSAFIAGRQIHDGPFILNEVLAGCKRKKKQAIIFKVDFAKAYDSVRWDFLLDGSLSLSHLFYADDAVFIGEWLDDKLDNLIRILNYFHLASGLKINVNKIQVLGVGVPLDIVNQGASRIGCSVMHLPFKYLGVMVGDHMSRYSAWSSSIQKIRTRLSMWKVKTLSVGGRLTLLKSVLGAVLTSKKKGGHGVSSFFALNRALLLKWVWRFLSQDGSLWSHVIYAIFEPRLKSHSFFINSTWGSILRESQALASKGFDFLSHCKLRVGNRVNTRFWLDTWILDMPLRVRFPRIYALDSVKEVYVAAKFGDPSLDDSFHRQVRDGSERQKWLDLLSMLDAVSLSSSSDRWYCDFNGDGSFRVKEVRSNLDDLFLPSLDVVTRRVRYVPIKINVFTWRARLDRLPTRGNLINKGVSLDSPLCPICGLMLEDSQHLFFRCDMAKCIFQRICHWWNLQWVDTQSFDDWLSWFKSVRMPCKPKDLLEGVFYTSWWHIWNFRNRLIFDASPPRCSVIFDDIFSSSFNWCVNRCNSSFSWEFWLKTPYLISL